MRGHVCSGYGDEGFLNGSFRIVGSLSQVWHSKTAASSDDATKRRLLAHLVWKSDKRLFLSLEEEPECSSKSLCSVFHVDLHSGRVHDLRVVLEVDDCDTFFPGLTPEKP